MKKFSIVFLIGIFTMFLFTGCGSQSQSAAPGSNTESTVSSVSDRNSVHSLTENTDTGTKTETLTSDASQETDSQNDISGIVGGRCITDQNEDEVTVPNTNYELDFDKDGTISSSDYELSGMSYDDFAAELVSDGDVGTSAEADQLINGEITVMCGVFNGTCD